MSIAKLAIFTLGKTSNRSSTWFTCMFACTCARHCKKDNIIGVCRRSRRKERKQCDSMFPVVLTGRARFIDVGIVCQARGVRWHAYACYLSPTRFKSSRANEILLKLYLSRNFTSRIRGRYIECIVSRLEALKCNGKYLQIQRHLLKRWCHRHEKTFEKSGMSLKVKRMDTVWKSYYSIIKFDHYPTRLIM